MADSNVTIASPQCVAPERGHSLNLFILQTFIIVALTRVLVFLLKPFRLPRVVAELAAGLLLSPSVLGNLDGFHENVYPISSISLLEALSNLGLLYFLFLVGLQMDFLVVRRTGRKAVIIAIGGMVVPFSIAVMLANVMLDGTNGHATYAYKMTLGIVVSVTAFPAVSRMVAELKLINTELGRIAMSSALVTDMSAWTMLAVAVVYADDNNTPDAVVGILVANAVCVLLCIYVVRPAVSWIIRRTPEGENINDLYICIILLGVLVCGYVANGLGTYSVFGAFIYGLVIPSGPITSLITVKLEDFVTGLLLPLFYTVTGLRTDLGELKVAKLAAVMVFIIPACAAKVGVTLLLGIYYDMSLHEGVALGLLMNTKGLTELVIINIASEYGIIDSTSYAVLVIITAITTSIITATIMVHNPTRRCVHYKQRTIQKSKQGFELPVLVCTHTPRTVPATIALLEASYPTKKSPLSVHALHLVELTDRESAMLIVHQTHKPSKGAINETQTQADHIFNAFQKFQQRTGYVYHQTLTAISAYSTMHEDICIVAENRRIAFIILPFHKHQTVDGDMEVTNPAYRAINQNVLANAPCSVGILVDRCFAGPNGASGSKSVVVLFFGGPDDREALSYALRMAENPEISLTLIRFLIAEEANESTLGSTGSKKEAALSIIIDSDKEKQRDDDLINAFRSKAMNRGSILFEQKTVKNGEETVAAIRNIDQVNDLYIVGRRQGDCPLTDGLIEWSECPELGAIGDILASSDFPATVSVLVVQQYMGYGLHDGLDTPDSSGRRSEPFSSIHNAGQTTPRNDIRKLPQRIANSDSRNHCILMEKD